MVHVFTSKDPCGMGLQMEWGASLTALVNSRILKHFLRMIFTAMDSILRLVLLGCLLQILSEQQCLKNAGKFHCLRGFIVGTRKSSKPLWEIH